MGRLDWRRKAAADDVQMVAERWSSPKPPTPAASVGRRTAQRPWWTCLRHPAVGRAIQPCSPVGRRQLPAPSRVRQRRRPSELRRRPRRRRRPGGRNRRPFRRLARTAAQVCTALIAPLHPLGPWRLHGQTAQESCRRPPRRDGAPGRTTATPIRGCVRRGRSPPRRIARRPQSR